MLQKNEFGAEQVEKNGMKLLMLKTDCLTNKEGRNNVMHDTNKSWKKIDCSFQIE